MNNNSTNYSKSLSRGVMLNRIRAVLAMSSSIAGMSCGGINTNNCCDNHPWQRWFYCTRAIVKHPAFPELNTFIRSGHIDSRNYCIVWWSKTTIGVVCEGCQDHFFLQALISRGTIYSSACYTTFRCKDCSGCCRVRFGTRSSIFVGCKCDGMAGDQ